VSGYQSAPFLLLFQGDAGAQTHVHPSHTAPSHKYALGRGPRHRRTALIATPPRNYADPNIHERQTFGCLPFCPSTRADFAGVCFVFVIARIDDKTNDVGIEYRGDEPLFRLGHQMAPQCPDISVRPIIFQLRRRVR
jgi:hypothetical protein